GQRYGVVYTDFEAFLEHRPMNLVAIGSPSGLHAEQGIAAARRGPHVLVERPIEINLKRADALIAECGTRMCDSACAFRIVPRLTFAGSNSWSEPLLFKYRTNILTA